MCYSYNFKYLNIYLSHRWTSKLIFVWKFVNFYSLLRFKHIRSIDLINVLPNFLQFLKKCTGCLSSFFTPYLGTQQVSTKAICIVIIYRISFLSTGYLYYVYGPLKIWMLTILSNEFFNIYLYLSWKNV